MVSTMQFKIEVPDEIAGQLARRPEELGRRILEGFAAESYRHGRWSCADFSLVLGLDEVQTEAFLIAHLLCESGGESSSVVGARSAESRS